MMVNLSLETEAHRVAHYYDNRNKVLDTTQFRHIQIT
jgi:hypothetical protein